MVSTLKNISLILVLLPVFSISQTKLSLDTSNLVNGNGIVSIVSNAGKNHGFITYKNGHIHGAYYLIDTAEETSLKGELHYNPDCVRFFAGVRIKYINEKKDTISLTTDSSTLLELFRDIPILETIFDSVPQDASIHPELNTWFGNDPAVVPIGKWELYDIKNKTLFCAFRFDDCGNTILRTCYNSDGSVIDQTKFTLRNKGKRFW